MTQVEDSKIIDLFFERSEQAIDELDKKHGAAVKNTAGNILRDQLDVEECANDTYLGVWNSIPPHRPNHLVSYVCKIARNLAITRLRSQTAAKRSSGLDLVLDELEDFLPSGADMDADLAAKELAAAVDRFLATLDYDDRFIFVRRYWYADAVSEIAAMSHNRADRISLRLFRLREKLRKTLQKEGLLV